MLAAFNAIQADQIQPILDFWAPLLQLEAAMDESNQPVKAYSFQHQTLQETATQACHALDGGVTIEQAHRNIVRTLEGLKS